MKRLERALEVVREALDAGIKHGGYTASGCSNILAEIDAILHPVEVEEVTVERWMCDSCEVIYDTSPREHGWKWCGAALNENGDTCPNNSYVKLSGTIRREKKVAERSVRMTIDSGGWRVEGHHEGFGGRGPITGTFEWTE